ncbi:MAG: SDR family NAD(P)-dependent oxidoreductase [Gammaproteobacteria bacterium]
MNQKLVGKVAIVTGGGSWIGKEIAALYASQGAMVFILGRDVVKLKQAVTEISHDGGNAGYIQTDISQEQSVHRAIEHIISEYGQVDIVVQNAAVFPMHAIDKMRVQDWQYVIDINLTGSFIVLKAVATIMKKQQSGKIVFISSIAGEKLGFPGFAHYAASKAGMNGLMRTAALELASYNITVNSIEPGNIFNNEISAASRSEMKAMLDQIPLRRLGKPIDVANLALFLATDESSFITGQNFVVDGGETIN